MSYYSTDEERNAAMKERDQRNATKKKLILGGSVIGGAIILIFILLLLCTTTIKPGYAGVVYNANGGVEEKALGQGWKVVAPWKHVTSYPVSTETVYLSKSNEEGGETDNSFMISTKDGKPISVDVSYSYHMDSEYLPKIFTKFRGQDSETIQDNYIRQRLKDSISNVTSLYGISEVYGEKRGEISGKIFDLFVADLAKSNIVIESFSFTDVRPDTDTMKAIQAKVDAYQKLEQAKIEKDKAVISADQKRIEAQGNADAKLINAEGQAKANAKLQQSITQELIDYEIAKAWDGKLPVVNGGSGTLLNVDSLVK